jgi:virulence factor
VGQVDIALIGVGAMTQRVHLPSLVSSPDVRIAAVCDLDAERMATVADHYGIERQFTDYRTMVDEIAPDGVYAVGQPQLMYDIWVWCLQQGLNLFVEKPLGLTWHQAQMLTQLAAERNVITQVGHQRRTSPLLVSLREACLARGPIVHAVCEFYKCDRRPFLSARDRMLDDGVHAIDTLRWICGGEVVGVESRCRRVGVPDINLVTATLQFDNDATGILVANWASGRRIFRVEMHGDGIACDADPEGEGRLYADNDVTGVAYDSRGVAGSDEFNVFAGFQAKTREFVESIATGVDQTSSPFRDAAKTMEVAETILAQALLRGA